MTNSEIELFKRQCNKAIQLRVALERLESNEDFNTIIRQGFCSDFALKQLEQSTRMCLDKEVRANALLQARSPSILKQYLNNIKDNAESALQQLEALENLNEDNN